MRRLQGFTLIEILVAMAIFTVIGVASNAVINTVIDSDELSADRFEKLQKLQRAMLTIERDVLQAVPRVTRNEAQSGEDSSVVWRGGRDEFESETDGMGFVRAGWHNPQLILPRSTLQPVVYRLQEGKLQRLYSNYVDNVIGFEPKIRVLLEDVEDFQVEYHVGSSGLNNSEESWKESYVGAALPKAIAITILSKDFGTIRREFVLPPSSDDQNDEDSTETGE